MAVCVVCYGVSETVFGEWSVMGSTIILVHSYYNVWLRAQLGWQSFLLRRDAVNKIKSLPTASDAQLEQYNDICAICYQVLTTLLLCLHQRWVWPSLQKAKVIPPQIVWASVALDVVVFMFFFFFLTF